MTTKIAAAIGVLLVGHMTSQAADDLLWLYKKKYVQPSEERIARLRADFLLLREPLPYRWVLDRPASTIRYDDSSSHIELAGHLKDYADAATAAELIFALWPYLENENYDAKACIILLALTRAGVMHAWFTYRSQQTPADWPQVRQYVVPRCRTECARALGEDPGHWYPHKVLFDWAEVVGTRTNAALRAKHVDAMRAALRDPKIGQENPLEVENILGLLVALKAAEAAPELARYFFYSVEQRGDYRMPKEPRRPYSGDEAVSPVDAVFGDIGWSCPAPRVLASVAGPASVLPVLDRLSMTTKMEREVQVGGGCAPVFCLRFFWHLKYSRAQAIAAIEAYVREHPQLTNEQKVALASLADDLRSGRYQGDRRFFGNDRWSGTGTEGAKAVTQRQTPAAK